MTVRELLQKLGTEAMRDGLHTNVWVNALMADYITESFRSDKKTNWIITDMRFPNEMEAVKEREGVTIRVIRPCTTCKSYDNTYCSNGYHQPNKHPSETAIDNAEFDHYIYNDAGIEELVEKVKEILIKEQII